MRKFEFICDQVRTAGRRRTRWWCWAIRPTAATVLPSSGWRIATNSTPVTPSWWPSAAPHRPVPTRGSSSARTRSSIPNWRTTNSYAIIWVRTTFAPFIFWLIPFRSTLMCLNQFDDLKLKHIFSQFENQILNPLALSLSQLSSFAFLCVQVNVDQLWFVFKDFTVESCFESY